MLSKVSNSKLIRFLKRDVSLAWVLLPVSVIGLVALVGRTVSLSPQAYAPLSAACLAWIIGYALYTYREFFRKLYGAFEVLVGLAMAAFSVWYASGRQIVDTRTFLSSEASLAVLLGFISAIFIVVRGLDNMGVGRSEEVASTATDLK